MTRIEFERVTPQEVGIHPADINLFLDELESGFTEMHGLMIMRHGKVCAEGWWAPYAANIRHGLQSLTKTYAATAVGIACDEGKLRLTDRIVDLFPDECPKERDENLEALTVRDVLCMGSGMETQPKPDADWIRGFLSQPVVHRPGTAFRYNSTSSSFLAAIVQRATGEHLHDYLKPRLYDKIGIDTDNLRWIYMQDGTEAGGGGLYATTEDNLRLMKMYADGGCWNGERILSESYVSQATKKQNDSAAERLVNPPAEDNFVGYGFQIWMCRPEGVYRADGARGQFSIVNPKLDMIVSINETADGATWAQNTLDCVWRFFEMVEAHENTPPEGESAMLAQRLKALSLPAKPVHPHAAGEKDLSGRWFRVSEGPFYMDELTYCMMGGYNLPAPIEHLKFSFEDESCILRGVYADSNAFCWRVALDGTFVKNAYKRENTPLTTMLMKGYWEDDHTFALTLRWVETCFEQEFRFQANGDNLRILLAPMRGGLEPVEKLYPHSVTATAE